MNDIIQAPLEEVMRDSMMPYAEHVILERALPRVEDGLKPVQRRILYTMMELSVTPDKPHRKCARIVGDCLGKYHPHGDSSVYDALVRLAQPFSMRGMLVDGHGNFGSIDGDGAAAMRYTEARMAPLAMQMLRDIEKDTVPFRLNFDDTLREPDLLPARYPNLLVNGASGIAVGLATNIPPHNLREACAAAILRMDRPDTDLNELMKLIPAPDFPTGGVLVRSDEIREAYRTGRGKLALRARVHMEKGPAGRTLICITEVPYQVSKSQMLEKILRLSEEKKGALGNIYDIRDESDRAGLRAVIEVKKDCDPEKVLRSLYKYSDMQVTYGVNLVAVADGKPRLLSLIDLLDCFIAHQKSVVTRRTQYDLDQAKARLHILEGLIIAVDNLDEVIALIRASQSGKEAKARLMERFSLTEIQAQAILDIRLQRLTNLEIVALRKEYAEIQKLVEKLESILGSEKKLLTVIKDELREIADKYGDERRTTLVSDEGDAPDEPEEDAPEPEETVILLTRDRLLRRMSPRLYEKLEAPATPDEAPWRVMRTFTDRTLLLFTSRGNCFTLQVGALAESMRLKERGTSLGGLLAGLEKDEKCVEALCVRQSAMEGEEDFLFFTKNGLVKRSPASEYAIRRARFSALTLKGNDELRFVAQTRGADDILMLTRGGFVIRFPLAETPAIGRAGAGVKGVRLELNDEIILGGTLGASDQLLVISERGFGKRLMSAMIDRQLRGGKGARCFPFQKNNATGSYLAAACLSSAARDYTVVQRGGAQTPCHFDQIPFQTLGDKPKPCVMALMDDVVTDIIT